MAAKQSEGESKSCSRGKIFLSGLLIVGTGLAVAGIMSWRAVPSRRVDRLLSRAQKKLQELEAIAEHLPSAESED
jgi:hypothetical protein